MFAGLFLGKVFGQLLDSLVTLKWRLMYFGLSLSCPVKRGLLEVLKILLLLGHIICLRKVPVVTVARAYLRRN